MSDQAAALDLGSELLKCWKPYECEVVHTHTITFLLAKLLCRLADERESTGKRARWGMLLENVLSVSTARFVPFVL